MARTTDNDFKIELSGFNQGLAPLSHIDDKTFYGGGGQASEMIADVITMPQFIQQSPGLADLTNGNQSGVVDQLIRFILDRPTATDITYAVGTSKLFKLSSTAVVSGGSPSWPQTITDMTSGESVIRLKENLFVFYNKASGGDIAAMPLSTEVIDPDWGSTVPGGVALENAPHPSAAKEDIMVFGNGRYMGVYVAGLSTLEARKLDFGEGATVVDVLFHMNMWWIAVNYGEGRRAQMYLYDGSAISNVLSDEVGLGTQQIGFLHVQNGNVFIAYEDKTASGYIIGWVSGRAIKPLRYFAGSLPDHRQKTLYQNTILYVSGEYLYSIGAVVEQLPIQVSRFMDGGYSTIGGVAAPFGTPLVASTESTNYRLAKLSGYSTTSNWKSVWIDTAQGRLLGKVMTIIVATKALESGATCTIKLEGNQGAVSSTTHTITGTGKTRHVIVAVGMEAVEDLRVVVDYTGGSTSVTCPIRKIELLGVYVER